jgi:hypothetical protein
LHFALNFLSSIDMFCCILHWIFCLYMTCSVASNRAWRCGTHCRKTSKPSPRNHNFIVGMIKDYRPWLLCDFQLPYKFGDVPHGFTHQQIQWNMKNDGQKCSVSQYSTKMWCEKGLILKMH